MLFPLNLLVMSTLLSRASLLVEDVSKRVDLMPSLVSDCRVCQGGTLAENLQYLRGNPAAICTIIHKILVVNQQMHARGLAHGDLKLDNILLRSKNNFEDVVVADFSSSTMSTGSSHFISYF